MTSAELENLVRIGKLKHEPPSEKEILGLLLSARERLIDAVRSDLSYSSRFDLAYAVEKWRVLAKAHERRNLAEYEGHLEHDDRLLVEIIAAAEQLRDAIDPTVDPPPTSGKRSR